MKRFALLFVSLAGMAFASLASAQSVTVPAELTASWTLPTETECLQDPPAECVRIPLTGAYAVTGVQLFVSASPIPDDSTLEPVASSGTVSSMVYNQTVPNGTTLYVRVKAVNAYGASKRFSEQQQKMIQVEATPGAPTNVSVSFKLTITP